jgi:hypothetical protein
MTDLCCTGSDIVKMINIQKCEPKAFSELRKSDQEMQSDQTQTKRHLTGDLAVPTNHRSKSTGRVRTFGPFYIILSAACHPQTFLSSKTPPILPSVSYGAKTQFRVIGPSRPIVPIVPIIFIGLIVIILSSLLIVLILIIGLVGSILTNLYCPTQNSHHPIILSSFHHVIRSSYQQPAIRKPSRRPKPLQSCPACLMVSKHSSKSSALIRSITSYRTYRTYRIHRTHRNYPIYPAHRIYRTYPNNGVLFHSIFTSSSQLPIINKPSCRPKSLKSCPAGLMCHNTVRRHRLGSKPSGTIVPIVTKTKSPSSLQASRFVLQQDR